jgi:ceramide glucosyltransferase
MDLATLATALPVAVSSALYTLVQGSFALTLARRRPFAPPAVRPWVSILKPVAGADDDLRENLESFAALDYPAYELLIGVASPDDDAIPIVQRFLAAHPGLRAELVLTTPARGAVMNPKVAQLIDLTKRARGSVLVVSDANVRVPRTYLGSLVSALLRPGVGLVSSLIAGGGERTLGAALENAQLGAAIAPAVVAAHRLFGRPVSVGKSMAMRRADLDRVGGWEAVASVLAEDDALGRRFHALGYGVELCLDPVENRNVSGSPLRSVERHARWSKMRRAVVPGLFWAEPFIWPVLVALAVAALAPSALSLSLVAFALALQIVLAAVGHALIGARRPLLLAALEPLRLGVTVASYALAATSRRVTWRGNAFVIGAGTELFPVRPAARIAGARALG